MAKAKLAPRVVMKGHVVIFDENGLIAGLRDIGDTPVEVKASRVKKANVLFEPLERGQHHAEPTYEDLGDEVDVKFLAVNDIVTPEMIKDEANRRIIAIMPEHKQRNSLALGLSSAFAHGIDVTKWPTDLAAEVTVALRDWGMIKFIRMRSNEIERMNPIPHDYFLNKYWS